MAKFPFIKQLDSNDCGSACLGMIAKYYGKSIPKTKIRDLCHSTKVGTSLLNLSQAAEALGFKTLGVNVSFDTLHKELPLPAVCFWRQNHFIVVYEVKKKFVYVADPAIGLLRYTLSEFMEGWSVLIDSKIQKGLSLLFEPTQEFYEFEESDKKNAFRFEYLIKYLKPHKKFIIQLLFGILLGTLFSFIFPFLTQSIIDIGIGTRNIQFVYLVLLAQLVLFTSQTSVEFIRNWILLHMSTRISISLISNFLIKLMKLPISFFDSRKIGDIIQRINDHSRIQSFLTGSTINILFSGFVFITFAIILIIYNFTIFLIFMTGSVLYIIWVILFLKKRKKIDYKRFAQMASSQSSVFQIITGMQEIKLNCCEREKRWGWERIQAKLFKVSIKGLDLAQTQQGGAFLINGIKNILVSAIAAKAVIDGKITLGMMVAIQYIIGQLNAPIEQLISFIHSAQDAKISLDRLIEVYEREEEEPPTAPRLSELPLDRNISLSGVSFNYEGSDSDLVLKELNLLIPQNKVTAIVGLSGAGKTTLLKLLLGFYRPTKGEIKIGDVNLNDISKHAWRKQCGVVMQDGYIFTDTIENNIKVVEEKTDRERLEMAIRIANVRDFLSNLPLYLNTVIGGEGHGLSQGQKQRILIARVIYKNPDFLFFDEATNSLDTTNEATILNGIFELFKGKTIVIIAHRLSTVKNADQIVVIEKGNIIEKGTHAELIAMKGAYCQLVRDQLNI